jgi:hypothetical protein
MSQGMGWLKAMLIPSWECTNWWTIKNKTFFTGLFGSIILMDMMENSTAHGLIVIPNGTFPILKPRFHSMRRLMMVKFSLT